MVADVGRKHHTLHIKIFILLYKFIHLFRIKYIVSYSTPEAYTILKTTGLLKGCLSQRCVKDRKECELLFLQSKS